MTPARGEWAAIFGTLKLGFHLIWIIFPFRLILLIDLHYFLA